MHGHMNVKLVYTYLLLKQLNNLGYLLKLCTPVFGSFYLAFLTFNSRFFTTLISVFVRELCCVFFMVGSTFLSTKIRLYAIFG